MINELRQHYPVPALCRQFHVSASGYYHWQAAPPSARQKAEGRLELEILAAHSRTRGTYGAERLQEDLAVHGIVVGIHRIKRIRRKLGIRCKQKKKFKATTNSKHNLPVAANILEQNFLANKPGQIWLTDITYVATEEGWLYLAGYKDVFTGEIVGYAMSKRMTKGLVIQALFRAVSTKRPNKGLIVHSDRGSQYCSYSFAKVLKQFDFKASMSRKGNCYDNAPMESFWGILKNEMIHHRKYATRSEAEVEIREYIEIFYNRQRVQKRLGYCSPVSFERKYFTEMKTIERFGVHY
jgi:putative transposase